MKLNEMRLARKSGALFVVMALLLGACGGSAPKPTVVTITSPAPNAQVDVGKGIIIKGVATGDNIVRVDILVDSKLYGSASSGDPTKGVSEMQIDNVAWTPTTANLHAIEFRAYGPNETLLGKSDPLVVTAKGALPPTAAPIPPTATPAPVPTAANPGTGTAATPTPDTGSSAPSVTVTNDFANVRSGPNTGYALLGQLQNGQTVPVRGKNADGTWWQISYAQGTGGVGWVFGELVQGNAAASGVPVASAPPLPTSPPPPPVVVQPTAIPATAVPVPVASGPKQFGNLIVDKTVVPPNGSVTVSWNVGGLQRIDFDDGAGGGYKPTIGTWNFTVSNITANRVVRLKATYSDGRVQEDVANITLDASAPAPAPAPSEACSASSPYWKAGSNPNYKFCARQDLQFAGDDPNLHSYSAGTDKSFTANWDIFGISGINIHIFPWSGGQMGCGPGTTVEDKGVNGTGSYTFNIKNYGRGLYKVELRITRQDGGVTGYNEKIFCIN